MKNNSSKTGLFLMELIIAILFFSLAGAVCIQLFVRSHIISNESVELNCSVLWAQNVAETFYGCNGDIRQMAALLGNAVIASDDNEVQVLTLFFDEDFQQVASKELMKDFNSVPAAYTVMACITEQTDLITCNIIIDNREAMEYTKDYEPVYTLEVFLFPDKEVSDE